MTNFCLIFLIKFWSTSPPLLWQLDVDTRLLIKQCQAIKSRTWELSWQLKREKKNSFSPLSLCPLLGEHLSHLANVHLPVVLLVHHYLIDNHLLPNGPTCIFAKMIKAPTFPATSASPLPTPFEASKTTMASPCQLIAPPPPPSKWRPSIPNCPMGNAHRTSSVCIANFQQGLGGS